MVTNVSDALKAAMSLDVEGSAIRTNLRGTCSTRDIMPEKKEENGRWIFLKGTGGAMLVFPCHEFLSEACDFEIKECIFEG